MHEVMGRLHAIWNFHFYPTTCGYPPTYASLHVMDPTQWCHVIVACKNLEGALCPNLVGCEQNCSLAPHEPHVKAPWACRYWWLLERKCCYCNIAATSLATSAAASAATASLCIGKGRCWAVGGMRAGSERSNTLARKERRKHVEPRQNTPWL